MLGALRQYLERYVELTDEEFDFFSQLIEERSYDRKERLLQAGEVEQYLNFVAKGLVRKYFLRQNNEIITHIIREGGIIASSVSFFSGTPSNYVIETIEPTTLLSISRDNLEKLFESDNKWERMGRLMMADFLLEKEYWLLDNICYSSRERFLRFMNEQPHLIQRVPQKYLASFLNIKPETFSRLKHLLTQKADRVYS